MKKHRYLFAKYLAKPRDPTKTHIKGYMTNPENVRYDEVVGFSVGLKKKDQDNQPLDHQELKQMPPYKVGSNKKTQLLGQEYLKTIACRIYATNFDDFF